MIYSKDIPLAAMLSCQGKELTDGEKYLFEKSNPLGVTLFSRNIENKKQLSMLISSIKEVIGRDNVLIAVDQEGGRVRRLTPPEWFEYASPRRIAQLDNAEHIVKIGAELMSHEFHEVGINMNFAPLLDIVHNGMTDALGDRVFSDNPDEVIKLAKAQYDTFCANGICPVIKHMPGHGRAVVDPHLHLPIIDTSLNELDNTDFKPFVAFGDAIAGMTAHIVINEIDEELPITSSSKAIKELIRERLGFKGFLFSDAIDMKALKGNISEKTRTSLKAGCDAVLYCFGIYEELEQVVSEAGPLTDEAMLRLSLINEILGNNYARTNDINKLNDEYQSSLDGVAEYKNDYDATEVLFKMQSKK